MAKQEVHVCEDSAQTILIGVDFLKANKCVINFHNGTVETCGGVSTLFSQPDQKYLESDGR